MKHQIVLVTGASSGLGLETARQLAQRGAQVILVCRDPARGDRAQQEVAKAAAGEPPRLHLADLSSQASIHELARGLNDSVPYLDVLINNAGGIFARHELTVDGLEKTFATNYLAPFLLTHLLLDKLQAAPGGRIVNIASALHGAGPDVLDNLQGEKKYNFILAYKTSKFALIVFTYALARRLEKTGITVNCVEPGPTRTAFGDNLTGLPRLFPLIMKRLPLFRPIPEGAVTPVYAASSPEIEGVTGTYFVNRKSAKTVARTHDRELAARLWEISAKLTHLETQPADLEAGVTPIYSRGTFASSVRP